MAFSSDTIAKVVGRLNTQYFLPAIQREFVWRPDQIIQLFDSLMRKYPVGSFLFWELQPENRDKWQVYKFVDDAKQGGSHNVLANVAAVQQLTLVLDGQQRLTSLLVGLKGSYTTRKKYGRYGDPSAWKRECLYLDLLKDPRVGEDDPDTGVCYGFRFFAEPPKNSHEHHWYKLGSILQFDSDDRFEEFVNEEEDRLDPAVTRAQIGVFRANLRRLQQIIWHDDAIAYYTEVNQDYDRVLDIFVRANEGGTRLSKSDLLLSTVTLQWEDVNAREEIYGFVDHLNTELPHHFNDLDKDWVLKTSLALSDLPVQYRVANFSKPNIELIRSRWDAIKSAIERTIRLVNTFGIDRDTLTSTNALIPIVYYLHLHPNTNLLGTTEFDVRNATLIRRWLLGALLNNAFGGSSDSALTDTRKVLVANQQEPDFPSEALNRQLASSGRSPEFNDYAMEEFLAITYGRREAFLALSLLYDESNWGNLTYHIDHIFPRAQLSPAKLKALGIPPETRWRYQDLVNRIGNLQLLGATENIGKSDQDFAEWLRTRDASFRVRHLIPADDALLDIYHFEEFVRAREELIRERLRSLFGIVGQLPEIQESREAA